MSAPIRRQIQPIPMVSRYFGTYGVPGAEIPVIAQSFTPGKGWSRYPFRKRVSRAWLRKMKAEGVTSVALALNGRLADFRIAELLNSTPAPVVRETTQAASYHGFVVRRGGQVEALTRSAVHGRPSGATVLIGHVWKAGRKWQSATPGQDGDGTEYATQEAAASALYLTACEALLD
jgi:hypothetical protein